MALNIGKVQKFTEHRPNRVADYDEMYEEIKIRYKDFINVGKVGYDDRTKLFHVAIADGFHEWMLLSYNQNRLACTLVPTFNDPQVPSFPPHPPVYGPMDGNLSWQLLTIQTCLNQLSNKLAGLEGRINSLEGKPPCYRPC